MKGPNRLQNEVLNPERKGTFGEVLHWVEENRKKQCPPIKERAKAIDAACAAAYLFCD
jgi:hypothetical protein